MSTQRKDLVKALLFPALCLLLVCLVTSGLLALTNGVTKPLIDQNLAKEANIKYHELMPEAEDFEPFNLEFHGKAYTVQRAKKGNDVLGYIFQTQHNGYGGPVICMTAIAQDGKVGGVKILDMSETAGLGTNAADPSYLEQYTGRSGVLQVVKNETGAASDIVAVSGATITSKAVTASVNEALELFAAAAEKGGH